MVTLSLIMLSFALPLPPAASAFSYQNPLGSGNLRLTYDNGATYVSSDSLSEKQLTLTSVAASQYENEICFGHTTEGVVWIIYRNGGLYWYNYEICGAQGVPQRWCDESYSEDIKATRLAFFSESGMQYNRIFYVSHYTSGNDLEDYPLPSWSTLYKVYNGREYAEPTPTVNVPTSTPTASVPTPTAAISTSAPASGVPTPTAKAPTSTPAQQADYGLHDPSIDDNDVTTWDCVYFGNYWQEDTNGDGIADQNDEKTPIKWRVLSVEGDDAFLLADQNLDGKGYNETSTDVTWETCTLRSWLNGYGAASNVCGTDYSGTGDSFISTAFSSAERQEIRQTTVVNDDNPSYGTFGGNDTIDRIYLLSIEEASDTEYGFESDFKSSSVTRRAKNTVYAIKQGAYAPGDGAYVGNGSWWLRSPGYYSYYAARVHDYGYGHNDGYYVNYGHNAVRPALHLSLSSSLWGKAGTVDSEGNVVEPDTPTATPGVSTESPIATVGVPTPASGVPTLAPGLPISVPTVGIPTPAPGNGSVVVTVSPVRTAVPTPIPTPGRTPFASAVASDTIRGTTTIPAARNVQDGDTATIDGVTYHLNTELPASAKKQTVIKTKTKLKKTYNKKTFKLSIQTNSNGKKSFRSSNKKVVTVSNKGKVKIKGYGKVKITVTIDETSKFTKAGKVISVTIIPDGIHGLKAASYQKGKINCVWSKSKKVKRCEFALAKDKKFNHLLYSGLFPVSKQKLQVGGKRLKRGKTFYIRMRTFVYKKGKIYYGDWTAVKKVTVR